MRLRSVEEVIGCLRCGNFGVGDVLFLEIYSVNIGINKFVGDILGRNVNFYSGVLGCVWFRWEEEVVGLVLVVGC